MSDLIESVATVPVVVATPRRWQPALKLVVGIGAFLVAIIAMRGQGWWTLLVVVLGLILMHSGGAELGRRRWGPGFDLTAWLCAIWLALLLVGAALVPWLPVGEHQDLSAALGESTMARPDLLTNRPLGTNNFGLDLLARVLYGARSSLVVSIGAVLIGLVVGGSIGILAGYFRKATDVVVGIFTNALLAVPPLILLIALATVLEPNLHNIAFGLSLTALPSMIRMARANTLTYAQREFVLAGKSMGASNMRIMMRELLPNVILPLLSYGMVIVSVLIVAEASLSFLGLGIQAPQPSWGNMIAEGEGSTFEQHPHIVLVPGVVVFLTVYSFNLLGERARRRVDPRQAQL